MMNKYILCVIILLIALLYRVSDGYCGDETPEQLVRNFYRWYFKTDSGTALAENNDEIYSYFAEQTINNIRADKQPKLYYFTRVGSYSLEWKYMEALVGAATQVAEDLFVIPVSFQPISGKITIIVVVCNIEGRLRITKIIDPCPYL
jgi:hypothetical protein